VIVVVVVVVVFTIARNKDFLLVHNYILWSPAHKSNVPTHEPNWTSLLDYKLKLPKYDINTNFVRPEICAVGRQASCVLPETSCLLQHLYVV
jgi:hypothetical protein